MVMKRSIETRVHACVVLFSTVLARMLGRRQRYPIILSLPLSFYLHSNHPLFCNARRQESEEEEEGACYMAVCGVCVQRTFTSTPARKNRRSSREKEEEEEEETLPQHNGGSLALLPSQPFFRLALSQVFFAIMAVA